MELLNNDKVDKKRCIKSAGADCTPFMLIWIIYSSNNLNYEKLFDKRLIKYQDNKMLNFSLATGFRYQGACREGQLGLPEFTVEAVWHSVQAKDFRRPPGKYGKAV
ncbi:hypothetical protein BWD09_01495 [Neisseria dentiae]|uniref:Uncharacterized protein n=1 Tax=Neisseria dentiae TaxID=194197 RepID=A0A1X3DEX9_9NEIS|nr:hypothetical protein BWD09_01495 [Neisseria dentiae]